MNRFRSGPSHKKVSQSHVAIQQSALISSVLINKPLCHSIFKHLNIIFRKTEICVTPELSSLEYKYSEVYVSLEVRNLSQSVSTHIYFQSLTHSYITISEPQCSLIMCPQTLACRLLLKFHRWISSDTGHLSLSKLALGIALRNNAIP